MTNIAINLLRRFIKDESGLTSVEYAVLGGIVVAAIVAVGATFTTDLESAFGALFDGT